MKCGRFHVRLQSARKPVRRVVARRLRIRCEAVPADPVVKVKFTIPHHVDFGQSICILGGTTELGEWDVKKSPCLTWSEGDVWSGIVELPPAPIEYKYFIKNEDGTPAEWQPCGNLKAEVMDGEEMEIADVWEGTKQETTIEMPVVPKAESVIPDSVDEIVGQTVPIVDVVEEAEETLDIESDSVSVEI